MAWRIAAGLLALGFGLTSGARADDSTVFRTLAADKLEALLKSSSIEFKKVDSKLDGVQMYDFKKNNFSIRLYNYQGKDLMLDALFNALPIDKVNLWNKGAKFSRAVLDRDDKGSYTVIESNLNFAGGVTQNTVREFMNTFDDELKKFDMFAKGAAIVKDGPTDEKIFKEATSEIVEKILDDLNLKYKKLPLPKSSGFAYEYSAKGMRMILTNWGKDLMVEARFKGIPLDKVNKYNLDRKFIRAVGYKNAKAEYTSLEANLDCAGGISEGILRHFITVFEGEVQDFARYLEKLPKEV